MSSRAPFDWYGIRRGVSRDERFRCDGLPGRSKSRAQRLPHLSVGLSFDPELVRRAPKLTIPNSVKR